MKKIYLSLVIVGAFSTAVAQRVERMVTDKEFSTANHIAPAGSFQPKSGIEIWSDDFDNPGDWIIDNDGQVGASFGWTIGTTNHGWSTVTSSGINSTSGGNYAQLNNGNPTATPGTQAFPVVYTMTLASPLNIPTLPLNTLNTDLVTLEFQQTGARFNDVQEVQISTDGTIWTTIADNSDVPVLSSTGGDPYPNPDLKSINLAPFIAGNAGSVWIRFVWTSAFPAEVSPNAWITYGWLIDDLKLITTYDDDLILQSAWIAGENNQGSEYGRTPVDQADANWNIGGQVFNNGNNTQNNLILSADFSSFTGTATLPSLITLTDAFMETTEPLTLTPGVYSGDYTLVSDEETGGVAFTNNTGSRQFEITPASTDLGSIYSLDGIGVYTTPQVTSLGTASFGADSHDGFVCANQYHIKNTTQISGIRVMLAAGTVAGGEIVGSFVDTTSFLAGNMAPIHNTSLITITAANISAGYVDLLFPSVVSLSSNAYYAAVALYSNGGTSHIRIRDDETVAQPFNASTIFIPNDQVYNGNSTAFGIRLLLGDTWGVGLDENTLTGVSVYPNPSEGVITVTNDKNTTNSIEVHDMLGKVVYSTSASTSTTIDLSSAGTGIYLVKVSNESGSMIERVVIK